MGKTKYIITSGNLSRKDFSICYRDLDNKINYFPIEGIREIYILNEVSLNTKLLDYLSRYGILIHFFNYYGNYSGTFYPKEQYLSGRLILRQTEKYKEDRIRIAKSIVKGISINMEEVLYHYYRHNKPVKSYIDNIRYITKNSLEKSNDIKQILFVEGTIWKEFYDALRAILPEDFYFKERVKRPPDNPINAMISFGNSLLYAKTIAGIYQTHLNPTISYLHEPSERRFSLALDISEVFKPIIVFKTILDLVNNNRISKQKHFDKDLNFSILNEEGKKLFISEFETRLNKTIEHPRLKRKVTYQTLIKYECYKLIKDILEGAEFIPYNDKTKS
ncbi:type I-B CRISPR-associated endonuclease Cas1 [Tissierella creatinini]|nr:type I-B CRISPR-associated endonuclease Cas1 [Tissierella creatinini]TJX64602.1 type I-B CRISPR-associated endonuclease Cas1 [Soehngenia saccharolytica]